MTTSLFINVGFLNRLAVPPASPTVCSGLGAASYSRRSNARRVLGNLVALFLVSNAVSADSPVRSETIGRTYDIVELDALTEIEARVASTPFDPGVFGEEEDWSALRSATLPVALKPNIREVIPFFTLTFDIPDGDGNILYPEGYTFNPLEYLTLHGRLIVVNESQLDWALGQVSMGDMVLLSGSNPLEATRRVGQAIFKLEDQVRDRFELRYVPSIVHQDGSRLVIEEHVPGPAPESQESDDG